MFELIQSISIDPGEGRAGGRAHVPADWPLFADHFPGAPLLPGTWLVELAAQIAGPLAEESALHGRGTERWAMLGMIRQVKFLAPAPLPASLDLAAEIVREDTSNALVRIQARQGQTLTMTGELLMMMIAAQPQHRQAIEARRQRIARWKRAR